MDPKNTKDGAASETGSAPAHENQNPGAGAGEGGTGMPRSVEAFLVGQEGAGSGGPTPGAEGPKVERRPLSDLTRRVLQRWGAGPFKGLALLVGIQVGVDPEDAELLGEVTVEGLRHSVVGVDEATEARWLVPVAYGLCALDAFLAAVERRMVARRDGAGNGRA